MHKDTDIGGKLGVVLRMPFLRYQRLITETQKSSETTAMKQRKKYYLVYFYCRMSFHVWLQMLYMNAMNTFFISFTGVLD